MGRTSLQTQKGTAVPPAVDLSKVQEKLENFISHVAFVAFRCRTVQLERRNVTCMLGLVKSPRRPLQTTPCWTAKVSLTEVAA